MTDISLFDAIAALLPVEQRELFYRRMAHLRKLNPNDEVLQVCEAMGFLALITREAPERIAHERTEIERMLGESVRAFQQSQKAAVDLFRRIEGRIENLPAGIAAGLDSAAIAGRISADIHRCFASSGLPDIANELRGNAVTLEESLKDFSTVAKTLSDPQSGILRKLNAGLVDMERHLETTMAELEGQLGRLRWSMLKGVGTLCGACILVGVVLGFLLARA
jgi:uncharacterized small protein (DUF1192 family)